MYNFPRNSEETRNIGAHGERQKIKNPRGSVYAMKKYLYAVLVLFLVFIATNPASAASWYSMSDEEFIDLCKNGSPAEVQSAIEDGADVNARDNNGWTPLMFAAWNNSNADVVETLIKNGADVNARHNK
jgi:ankyrin repeat protein